MSDYDWSRFTLKININASLSAIYLAWTMRDELEKWFLRKAIFCEDKKVQPASRMIQPGDTYEWYWHGHDDKVVEKGKVLHADGLQKLQFSFSGGGIVTVDIGEAGGETIVMLTQEKIPTDEHGKVHYHMGCKQGWTFYLANLKSYLEGGIDLRNKNVLLSGVINA
jgi:uncharacterized protein YndB with AHSA1/START domain